MILRICIKIEISRSKKQKNHNNKNIISIWKAYITRKDYIDLLHKLRKQTKSLYTEISLNTVLKSSFDPLVPTFFKDISPTQIFFTLKKKMRHSFRNITNFTRPIVM